MPKLSHLIPLSLLAALLITPAIASEKQVIICDQDSAALSALFEQNWEPRPNYYFSYLAQSMSNIPFTGALHTDSKNLPKDKNPHLSFAHISVNYIDHYGMWQIVCHYPIGNPDMEDEGHELSMDASLNADNCRQLNQTTAVCG